MELTHDNALSPVYDKCTRIAHQGHFAHVDDIFGNVIPVFETERYMKGCSKRLPLIDALYRIQFWIRELILDKIKDVPTIVTFDGEHLAKDAL